MPWKELILNDLGVLLADQGEHARAESYYRQALLAARVLAQDLPFDQPEKAAALLKPTPQTLIWAANYADALEQQLPAEGAGARLRGCAQAYQLTAALHERMRREVLQRDESKLKGLLAQARYVHFATHGILGFDTGRQPALVLSLVGNDGARDENGTNDGFLELTEVTSLQLNADLVVLSACRSGEGRLHNGEGISGLARAFPYAGSRGVVCSLWSVDDAATAELMQGLYRRLQAGQPAAQALREAKLAMIRDRRAPVYWAPFILMGQ